jgi:hypothetical protein
MHLGGGDGCSSTVRERSLGSSAMSAASTGQEFDEQQVSPSPFRAAFGRARIEALAGTGVGRDTEAGDESVAFEYALLKRGKKRSADETLWNALGLEGWELVGVTGKHAAFKRPLTAGNAVSR